MISFSTYNLFIIAKRTNINHKENSRHWLLMIEDCATFGSDTDEYLDYGNDCSCCDCDDERICFDDDASMKKMVKIMVKKHYL